MKEMPYDAFLKAVELTLGNVKIKNKKTGSEFTITGVSNDGKPIVSNPDLKKALKIETLCDFEVIKD